MTVERRRQQQAEVQAGGITPEQVRTYTEEQVREAVEWAFQHGKPGDYIPDLVVARLKGAERT